MLPNLKEKVKKFETRRFEAKDYDMLSIWWKQHEWPAVPFSCLPTFGLIIECDKLAACAGFLYATDSNISILEWVVSNPDVDALERSHALDILLVKLEAQAKEYGSQFIFTFLKHERLMKRVEDHGFLKTDSEMQHYVKEISG